MLKKLSIENFQSHKETDIDLSEGVNAITGQSDSGKSAVIRSLVWLLTNRPSGESFKNWASGKKDRVAVELMTDKDTVAIVREDGETSYILNDDTFRVIKTDVPSEVSAALNIAEYNIQTQHQRYFLLQDTPGEVARKLNDLVDLNIIDSSFKHLSSKIRNANANIIRMKEERKNLETWLEKFEHLDEVGKLIADIEEKMSETAEIEASLQSISKNVNTLAQIKKDKGEIVSFLKAKKEVDRILSMVEVYKSIQYKIEYIKNITQKLSNIQEEIQSDKLWIELEPSYERLNETILKYLEMKIKKDSLGKMLSRLESTIANKRKNLESKENLILMYTKIVKEKGICPTCGSKIDAKILARIGENI
ncbi:MAG: YcjX family protein [Methanogenium sp.]|jgi:exonuclease SbcC